MQCKIHNKIILDYISLDVLANVSNFFTSLRYSIHKLQDRYVILRSFTDFRSNQEVLKCEMVLKIKSYSNSCDLANFLLNIDSLFNIVFLVIILS
jgi:hypothetical protein